MSNSIGMDFVLIPPGEFMMGSSAAEIEELFQHARACAAPDWYTKRLPAEGPRHRVRTTKATLLGMHEVTQSPYQQDPERESEFLSNWRKGSAEFSAANLHTLAFPEQPSRDMRRRSDGIPSSSIRASYRSLGFCESAIVAVLAFS